MAQTKPIKIRLWDLNSGLEIRSRFNPPPQIISLIMTLKTFAVFNLPNKPILVIAALSC